MNSGPSEGHLQKPRGVVEMSSSNAPQKIERFTSTTALPDAAADHQSAILSTLAEQNRGSRSASRRVLRARLAIQSATDSPRSWQRDDLYDGVHCCDGAVVIASKEGIG